MVLHNSSLRFQCITNFSESTVVQYDLIWVHYKKVMSFLRLYKVRAFDFWLKFKIWIYLKISSYSSVVLNWLDRFTFLQQIHIKIAYTYTKFIFSWSLIFLNAVISIYNLKIAAFIFVFSKYIKKFFATNYKFFLQKIINSYDTYHDSNDNILSIINPLMLIVSLHVAYSSTRRHARTHNITLWMWLRNDWSFMKLPMKSQILSRLVLKNNKMLLPHRIHNP